MFPLQVAHCKGDYGNLRDGCKLWGIREKERAIRAGKEFEFPGWCGRGFILVSTWVEGKEISYEEVVTP